MQQALQAQQQSISRPPMPPPQLKAVRKQRVITPEMMARRPVESKHNIMMRSRHKNSNDSVSNSVITDSTEQIQNTKTAIAQRKRDTEPHRSPMERKENAGASFNVNGGMDSYHNNSNNKHAALAQLVAALSVNNGRNAKSADDDKSSSITDVKKTVSNSSASANNISVPLTTEFKRSITTTSDISKDSLITVATEKFMRSMSTKSDISKDSLITEAEIMHHPCSPRDNHPFPQEKKHSIDSDRVNAQINSKASNLIPTKRESRKGTTQLMINTELLPAQPSSTFSPVFKEDVETQLQAAAQVPVEAAVPVQAHSPVQSPTPAPAPAPAPASAPEEQSASKIVIESRTVNQEHVTLHKNATNSKDEEGLKSRPKKTLVDGLEQSNSRTLRLTKEHSMNDDTPRLVAKVESKYEANDSKGGKERGSPEISSLGSENVDSVDYQKEAETSPEAARLGNAKSPKANNIDGRKDKKNMKLDMKSNEKINPGAVTASKTKAKKMGKSNTALPKSLSVLSKKSNVTEEEMEYAVEENEEYSEDDDGEVRDEPEETSRGMAMPTGPLVGKNADKTKDKKIGKSNKTLPRRSSLLGKKSKDPKKTIPKMSTLLGKKSKIIEEEREYAVEEEEESGVDEDEDVRDEPEETNHVKRHEEESCDSDRSMSMKSTLSNAHCISVESSVTNDYEAFVGKRGVLKRTASLVRHPGRTLLQRPRIKADKEGEEIMKSMEHGRTAARADNRKMERFVTKGNPIIKHDDCTPDTDEMYKMDQIWVKGNATMEDKILVQNDTIKSNDDMIYNDLTYDVDSMYDDNTKEGGTQTQMDEHGFTFPIGTSFPIIRNASSGIRQISSFQSLKEIATQTSNDEYVPIFSPTNGPAGQTISDDFVQYLPGEIGTVDHIMESCALLGAKVCMGSSRAMLSCVDACNDDPPGTKMAVLSPRHDVAPAHHQATAAQRCTILPSSFNCNAEHQPSSNYNKTDQEMAGVFTRAFAMALNKTNGGNINQIQEQQAMIAPQRHHQRVEKADKFEDFLSVDGMFVSPRHQHQQRLKSVPQKIAVKPKKRRHAVEADKMKHHASKPAMKPRKQVQIVENEMKHPSDQIDELRELTRTNSLIRSESNGSKTKSKGVRKFFNKIGRMRVGFMYEV